MLDFNGDETLAHLKNLVCEREKTDDVLLYVSGKPLSEEGLVSSIENCAVDVTVPLLGERFMVLWLVPVKSVGKHQKSMHKKRRKNEQVVLNGEFSITDDLSTL